jgi:sulfur-carrier protein adenylyltransferase/sulfurtransferase
MKRYNRQIRLEGFGIESQKKLAIAKVLVIGAGGLGCPAITYLASAGVGTLGIADHDLIDETNLHRQPIYTVQDIGKPKVSIAEQHAHRLNPEVKIFTWQEKIHPENAINIIKEFDVVLDCSDNFEARYLVNDACVLLNKPWIYGAVEAWNGQLAVFNYKSSPTYRCIFPEATADALNCNDVGVIGTVPGTVGLMQANEAIKLITGIGTVQQSLLLIDLMQNKFQTIRTKRNDAAIAEITALQSNYSLVCQISSDTELSAEEFLSNPGNYIVIDIREGYEVDNLPFSHTAKHIPMAEILENKLSFEAEKNYLLICATGMRSLSAVNKLKERYPDVKLQSLKGGVTNFAVLR